MLNRKTLKRINERPRQVSRLPLAAIGAGSVVLAALLFVQTSSLPVGLAALAAGAAGVLVAYRVQMARGITSLSYEGNLDEILGARFLSVQQACEELTSSQKIWRLTDPPEQRASKKASDVFLPPSREPVRVGLLETPGIRADVSVWGIDLGEKKIYFFPDAILIRHEERYEGLSYKVLKVSFSPARFLEREAVPEDAEVLEGAGRSQIPVVLYGLLKLTGSSALQAELQVSSRGAAVSFARAFAAEPRGAQKGASRADRQVDFSSAEVGSACMILGVAEGASIGEITAAYRRLARAYHPDRVVNQTPEVRELAERQMKAINIAYTELKRRGNSSPR